MNISQTSGFRPEMLPFGSACGILGAAPAHAPVALRNPLQDKNFFLLSAIERTPAVRALVQSDPTLAKIPAANHAALPESPGVYGADVPGSTGRKGRRGDMGASVEGAAEQGGLVELAFDRWAKWWPHEPDRSWMAWLITYRRVGKGMQEHA